MLRQVVRDNGFVWVAAAVASVRFDGGPLNAEALDGAINSPCECLRQPVDRSSVDAMGRQNPHLAVIGDRQALVWVLENQRVAFPRPRYHHIFPTLDVGDALYLYTTRGCYKNPTRDRSLIIGSAIVTDRMETSDRPLQVGDREFPIQAAIETQSLAPAGDGIEVAAEVPRLTSFPRRDSWAVYLRRSLFPVTDRDARCFDRLLKRYEGAWPDRVQGYRRKAKMDVG